MYKHVPELIKINYVNFISIEILIMENINPHHGTLDSIPNVGHNIVQSIAGSFDFRVNIKK